MQPKKVTVTLQSIGSDQFALKKLTNALTIPVSPRKRARPGDHLSMAEAQFIEDDRHLDLIVVAPSVDV